jgi:hypothetical protein
LLHTLQETRRRRAVHQAMIKRQAEREHAPHRHAFGFVDASGT